MSEDNKLPSSFLFPKNRCVQKTPINGGKLFFIGPHETNLSNFKLLRCRTAEMSESSTRLCTIIKERLDQSGQSLCASSILFLHPYCRLVYSHIEASCHILLYGCIRVRINTRHLMFFFCNWTWSVSQWRRVRVKLGELWKKYKLIYLKWLYW